MNSHSTLNVEDDPFVDVSGQEGVVLSVEVDVAGGDVDEDPWEPHGHRCSPLADGNA